jgi:hypothetical protein
MSGQHNTERILDAFLAPEPERLADRVIDAALADVARTPQRRAMRVPWRLPNMISRIPATGIAAAALLVLVGAGGLIYLNSRSPSGPGGPGPVSTPVPSPTEVAPGIAGWKTYTSAVSANGYGVHSYPADWSVSAPATREWRAGDDFPADELPYADTFVSPGEEDTQISLIVWKMPAGNGADIESVDGLKTWAEEFCNDVGASSCEGLTQQTLPMCLNAAGDSCRGALLVPTATAQYAFFSDWGTVMMTNQPDRVIVVVVAREDSFPPAARYGGSVELLKSILTTMDVWTPGQQPRG